ncbi:MAG: Lpg1974 family pore-forming outer membrane protein [Planctomycetota bacterium]
MSSVYRAVAILITAVLALLTNQMASAQSGLATTVDSGWVGSFDSLFWSMRSSGVEYGVTDIGGVQDRGPVGEILSLSGEYEAGFRFSVGRQMANGPELLFEYTDFRPSYSERYVGPLRATFVSADNSENDDSDNINTLGVETVTPDDRATSALAEMSFDYQVYDFALAQSLRLTESLSLRLSGAGRAASIDSEFGATYTGGDFQTAFNAFKNGSYRGGGVVVGGDLIWYLTQSLQLNIGTGLGLMMGSVETRVFIPDDEPGVPTDVTFDEMRMTPLMDMSVGLDFQRKFGSYLVSIASGYEMTHWFNLSDTRVFTDAYIEAQNAHLIDDVSLDGAYIRIALAR